MEKRTKEEVRQELLKQDNNDDYKGFVERIELIDPQRLACTNRDGYERR